MKAIPFTKNQTQVSVLFSFAAAAGSAVGIGSAVGQHFGWFWGFIAAGSVFLVVYPSCILFCWFLVHRAFIRRSCSRVTSSPPNPPSAA
jgi:hypothetical protein